MIRPRLSGNIRQVRSSRLGRFFVQLAVLLLVQFCFALFLWMIGFIWFSATILDESIDDRTNTDAIVVLTGGTKRLQTGLELLADNKGRKLLISGVNRGVDIEEILRTYRVPARLTCCIEPGYSANDTTGNAAEAANWMNWEGFSSMRLVTSNYHMPRSLLEFRAAMPNITIVPYPVVPDTMRDEGLPARWTTVRLIAREYTKYLLARLRLWIVP